MEGTINSTDDDEAPLLDGSKKKEDIPFISCRMVLAFFAWLGFLNVYALRVNLSVALVAMVNSSYTKVFNQSATNECPGEVVANTTDTTFTGEFNWDQNTQGLVLGAFFYGYITTQVPGGWLAERFGGKLLFGFGVLCTSVLTLVTPIAARWNVYLFLVVRVLEGIGEGVTTPTMHAMLARWVAPLERTKYSMFIYAGAQFGTVVSLPISGWLCAGNFLGGWPSVFYVFGTLGCIWFVAWMLVAFDSPAKHPRITAAERDHIEKSIGHQEKVPPVPWISVFTSIPFWSVFIAHFCNNWGFYTLLTTLPTYMKEVLKFNISQNGVLSALPYLAQWILQTTGGQIADFLRFRRILSTTAVRKLAIAIGFTSPAICLTVAGYVGCDKVLAVALVTAAVGMSGLGMSGYGVNHLDLAPPFAGTLMGLTNAFATIPGFAGPAVVGLLTNHDPSRAQWQKVFFISAGVYLFGVLVYTIGGSGVEQSWASPDHERKSKERAGPSNKHTLLPDGVLQYGRHRSIAPDLEVIPE